MSDRAVKPCGRCGSRASYFGDEPDGYYYFVCNNTDCGLAAWGTTKAEAQRAWNKQAMELRRSIPQASVEDS